MYVSSLGDTTPERQAACAELCHGAFDNNARRTRCTLACTSAFRADCAGACNAAFDTRTRRDRCTLACHQSYSPLVVASLVPPPPPPPGAPGAPGAPGNGNGFLPAGGGPPWLLIGGLAIAGLLLFSRRSS